MFTGPGCNT